MTLASTLRYCCLARLLLKARLMVAAWENINPRISKVSSITEIQIVSNVNKAPKMQKPLGLRDED
jgi:hypothetical protein